MLALGHEELQLKKKRMIDWLEKSEEQCMESIQSFTASLHLLSSTLQNGCNTLGMMHQSHQKNQHQWYNFHPQYQQQQSDTPGF